MMIKAKRVNNILILLCIIFCLVLLASCNTSKQEPANNEVSGQLKSIKIASSLPELPIDNLGIGIIIVDENPNVSVDQIAKPDEKEYSYKSCETYKNPDNDDELHVTHFKNNANLTLEQFTKARVSEFGISPDNYVIIDSSVFSRDNHKVLDGYYVRNVKSKDNVTYLCQESAYQEDNDFVIVSYLYKCTDIQIADTRVHINIPDYGCTEITNNVYGSKSKRYTYDPKSYIPTITYYVTSKTLDQALTDYQKDFNAKISRKVVAGVECGVAFEENKNIGDQRLNITTCFIPIDGKVVAIDIREPSDDTTLAIEAIWNGISIY